MKKIPLTLTALAFVGIIGTASAVPVYGSFGSEPTTTFGGSGIPNAAVAKTSFGGLDMYLTAHQRYANPALTNDGAGTFYATLGGDVLNGQPGYGVWNFGFESSGTLAQGYTLKLLYDLNPAINNVFTTGFALPVGYKDSWNNGMGFLGGGFNPSVAGEYSYALVVLDTFGAEVARDEIRVLAGSPTTAVPDSGAGTMSMIGLGLVGLTAMRRRLLKH